MDFTQAFGTLLSAEKVAKTVDSAVRNVRGHKRAVLRELQENIQLLLLTRQEKLPLDKVVAKLERTNYLAAADSGFNFKLIKRSIVKRETTRKVPQLSRYVGWSTEQLFENIYIKVKQLKDLIEISGREQSVNLGMRLENLLRLMVLLLHHIRS